MIISGVKIEIEVSIRDCKVFQEFLRDSNIEKVYDFKLEQESSNSWILSSDDCLEDYEVQDLINELEEIFEGFEVEFIPEY